MIGPRDLGRLLRRTVSRVAVAFDREDLQLLLGLALVGYGLSLWSHALAYVLVGAILLRLVWPASPVPRRTDE